jgi:hypothetical protein
MKITIAFFVLNLGLFIGKSYAQSIPQATGYTLSNDQDYVCWDTTNSIFTTGNTPLRFTLIPVDESGKTVLISTGGELIDPQKIYLRYDTVTGSYSYKRIKWSGVSENIKQDSTLMWIVEPFKIQDFNRHYWSQKPARFTIRSAYKKDSLYNYLFINFSQNNVPTGNFHTTRYSGTPQYGYDNNYLFWSFEKVGLLEYNYAIDSSLFGNPAINKVTLMEIPAENRRPPKFTVPPNIGFGLHRFNRAEGEHYVFQAGRKVYITSVVFNDNTIDYQNVYEMESTDTSGFSGFDWSEGEIFLTDNNYLKIANLGSPHMIDSIRIDSSAKKYSAPLINSDGHVFVLDNEGIVHLIPQNGYFPSQSATKTKPAKLELFEFGNYVGYYTESGSVYLYDMAELGDTITFIDSSVSYPALTKIEEQRLRIMKFRSRNSSYNWVDADTSGKHSGQYIGQSHNSGNSTGGRTLFTRYDSILHLTNIFYVDLSRESNYPDEFFCDSNIPNWMDLVLLGDSNKPLSIATNPIIFPVEGYEHTDYLLVVVGLDVDGNYQLKHYKLPDIALGSSYPLRQSYNCNTDYPNHPRLQNLAELQANINDLDSIVHRWQANPSSNVSNDDIRKLFNEYFEQIMILSPNTYSLKHDWKLFEDIIRLY